MAYDIDNPPALIAQGVGGMDGMRWFGLYWVDPIADVLAPGYITNAEEIGMRAGDAFRYKDTNRGEWDQYDLIVLQINADGSADLAFPEQPEEAYPTAIAPPGGQDPIEIIGFIDGRATRITFGEFIKTTATVMIEQFGDVDTDFDAAFADAIDYCHTNGTSLAFRPYTEYFSRTGLTASDKNVRIIGNGATIVRAADGDDDFHAIALSVPITNVNAVIANSVENYDYSAGTAGTSRVTRLEMASAAIAAQYAVGDAVKIVADDLIPSSDASDFERVGEIFTIGAIDGAYIYALSTLVETYNTNVRLGKLGTRKLDIRDLRFTDEEGSSTLRRKSMLSITAYDHPYLQNITVEDCLTVGVERHSCNRAKTFNVRGINLRTVLSGTDYVGDPGTFAYTLVAYGDNAGHDVAPYGERVRHVWTSGARLIADPNDSDLTLYGATINSKVDDLLGHDTSHYAADTHSDAFGVVFSNPQRTGGHQGVLAGIYAAQLRGRNCRVEKLNSYGRGGVTVKLIGNDGGHVIELDATRPEAMITTNNMIRIDGAESATRGRVTLNGRVKCSTGFSPLMEVVNAEITADSELYFDFGYQTGGAPVVIDVADAVIRGTYEFDFSRSDVANTSLPTLFRVMAEDTGLTDIAPERIFVRCAEASDNFYIADLQSEVARIVAPVVDSDVGQPTDTGGGFANIGVGSTVFCTPTRAQGTSTDRRDIAHEFTVTGAQAYDFSVYGYGYFTHRVRAAVSGVQITSLPDGKVDGQFFALCNNLSGPVENILLVNGSNLALGGNITLLPYGTVMLQWSLNTAAWRPVARFVL